MSHKPHVLFLTEKWADANPNRPLTNNDHNLFGSLEASDIATFHKIHYDEYYHHYGRKIDDFVVEMVGQMKPDALVVCILPWHPLAPSDETYRRVHHVTKIIFIWPDLVHFQSHADRLACYAALSVTWDADRSWYQGTNFVHLWTPQDPRIYYDSQRVRDIGVAFAGNANYPDRRMYLDFLASQGVRVFHVGGRDNGQFIPVHQYAECFQRSQIVLNFSLTQQGIPQLKGRIFEAMSCGALLMESTNHSNWIQRWYIPGLHYVPFANPHELQAKIKYYLNNHEEREKIAQNGWRLTKEKYSNTAWWELVFREAGIVL